MAWGTTVPDPPIPPAVPGWFAVFNLLARQFISLTSAAQVIGFVSALQTTPITNTLVAKGIQQGDQNFALTNNGNAAASPTVAQDFSVTESALLIGAPAANNPLLISDTSSVVGLVLSPQQFNVLNQGTITGSEAIVTAPQFVPITDAATIKGIQAGGQSFTVVSGASWYGKPGMDQVVAITESGTVKGISAAAVSFTVTNTGAVYARLTGTQSFTLNNAPSSFYGKPTAAESFAITNAATAIQVGGIVLDAVSTPYVGTSASVSFTHTASAGSYVMVVLLNNTTFQPTGATYDGVAMTLVTEQSISALGRLEIYERYNVPGGTKTIAAPYNSPSQNVVAVAISYLNVVSRSSLFTNISVNGVPSIAVSGVTPGEVAIGIHGSQDTAFTPTGGTNRVNALNSGPTMRLIISDATVDTTFTGTGANRWFTSIGFVLQPI